MFPFFLEHLGRNLPGGAMDLSVARPLQLVQTVSIQNLVVHIQAVIEKIALNEFDGVFNLALAFRVGPSTEVNLHLAVLAKLLKFAGVDDVAAVLADADNAVIENFFGLLKSELLYLQEFQSMEHFK